ncbi:MAG: T9SS type A sorting domain-containing protein [Chitinophagaceae bacterium]|nr:MAG: T9SS type A sorting domain-containing protein [Chitinophagaceae bacterium]
MKNCLTALVAILFSVSSFAATITAVTSTLFPGNWSVGSTWSSGTVPQHGDLVIIPLGLGVEVSGQVYTTAAPTLSVEVSGTLHFKPSGKLDLGSTSYLQLFLGGKIIPQNTSSSQLVNIGGVTKYNAANNGILLGPAYANSISGSSRPGFPLSGFDVGVLPVKLVSFSAKQVSGTAELHWKTAGESDTYFFEVEKSLDEGRTWTVVNKTFAHGSPSDYMATDRSPTAGVILYRLKTVDRSGSFTYSSIIKMDKQSTVGLFVSPNPSKGNLNITVSADTNSNTSIRLLNFFGQIIKKIECQSGRTVYNVDAQGVAKGTYLVAVYREENPVVKQTVIIQ